MADEPKSIGVIAYQSGLNNRTVELVMARTEALAALEGRIVAVCAGPHPLGHGGFVRGGGVVRVLAVHVGKEVEVLLNAPLATLVPGAAVGDALYFAHDAFEWAQQQERREVEAWKAARRREDD